MLSWHANFQIPNSGTQAADVFAIGNLNETKDTIVVDHYAEKEKINLLFTTEHPVNVEITNVDSYLLSLEAFAEYTIV